MGQLVQVLRSNGKYTYGKVMDYDQTADNYSIMTKAGPKYMVEKDDIYVNGPDVQPERRPRSRIALARRRETREAMRGPR